MKLVVLDRRPMETDVLPEAINVRLCSHPTQLVSRCLEERMVASMTTAYPIVQKMIAKTVEGVRVSKDPDETIIYIDIQQTLEGLQANLAFVDRDTCEVGMRFASVRRGKFFSNKKESSMDVHGISLRNEKALDEWMDMVSVARFILQEMK